jgi:hypothetical protein
MSNKPANWCDECKHYTITGEEEFHYRNVCALGHKPRFYVPKTNSQAYLGIWGWKRKCENFIRGEE